MNTMRLWFLISLTCFVNSKSPIDSLVHKPNLITQTSILSDHEKLNDDFHNSSNPASTIQLAYVTPWNNRGYELAKLTAHKLSHVSPVWFQIKPQYEEGVFETCRIEGAHGINRDWINLLRQKNKNIRIVPRLIFDNWSKNEMDEFLVKTQLTKKCINTAADFYQKNEFDGIVVEFYLQAIMVENSMEAKLYIIETMEEIADIFHKRNLEVIFTVPQPLFPTRSPSMIIEPQEFREIAQFADYVQVMTYDYNGDERAGVSPYNWFKECISYLGKGGKSEKLLSGINWYGYEYTTRNVQPIIGKKFLDILSMFQDLEFSFDEHEIEHILSTPESIIYYPSLTSLEARMKFAREKTGGIAIWDYGQGLDYFTNLLV
ncbi:unnamed protein product [Caenorhabditis bovis]|uniref:GH18 domain-containing protein n=1 Tax=Caenorhabditis bovis TaxID=2654633 RepID=A0A8S1EQC5_9PELO|nr:unnamed protein product [Caenorhabditis bovis]